MKWKHDIIINMIKEYVKIEISNRFLDQISSTKIKKIRTIIITKTLRFFLSERYKLEIGDHYLHHCFYLLIYCDESRWPKNFYLSYGRLYYDKDIQRVNIKTSDLHDDRAAIDYNNKEYIVFDYEMESGKLD